MSLTKEDIERYSRQMVLKEVGEAGQEKIKNASVLIVGVGGLGSPAALYLAAAGVGRLGLVDFDSVDVSNLQRQVLYSTSQKGELKANAAKNRLKELNPEIQIESYPHRLEMTNALALFAQYDFILDGADNFSTRYLVNDAAHFTKKPLVSASIMGFEGQLAVFNKPSGPCYRCLYPEPPPAGSVPSCAEAGVLGALPGILGSLQATEVLKMILGLDSPIHQLHLFDGLSLSLTNLEIAKNPDCPLCGAKATIKELKESHFVCALPEKGVKSISAEDLKSLIKNGGLQILDVREPFERLQGFIENSLHIPLGELEQKYSSLSQETPLVVYCKSGGRSSRACKILMEKGFNCINLEGGFSEFK